MARVGCNTIFNPPASIWLRHAAIIPGYSEKQWYWIKYRCGARKPLKKTLLRVVKNLVILLVSASTLLLSACAGRALAGEGLVLPTPTIAPASTALPTALPTPIPCDRARGGQVERLELSSALLEHTYTVSVYTPPCYGEEEGKTYPVLYLLHGQNMDDTFWLELGAADLVDEMIAQGGPSFLMVMPYEVGNFDPAGESLFPDVVLNELIPWVEAHYTVCTERDCRAIGGVSRGGGWAMRLAARNFDTFGAVGAHSMGLMLGDAWQIQKHLETRSRAEYPRIYLDRGEDDFLYEGIDYFVDILTRNAIPHEFHIYPGQHDQAYWQAHVAGYLQWYAAGWE